ncbi:unnamed protein product [Paramecium sonneborni]|uniref:Uncharacterized protein n=1 Tax=Paramecium sonneborni TaxID=65129 RepID=A0A8S1RRS1_9CILI|nr:unnamed protein product [Paramecium sonneborni]
MSTMYDGQQLQDNKCHQVCGDGIIVINSIEVCNDGNYNDGDDCYQCQFECIPYCFLCSDQSICLTCIQFFIYQMINALQNVEMVFQQLVQKSVKMIMINLMMDVINVNSHVQIYHMYQKLNFSIHQILNQFQRFHYSVIQSIFTIFKLLRVNRRLHFNPQEYYLNHRYKQQLILKILIFGY